MPGVGQGLHVACGVVVERPHLVALDLAVVGDGVHGLLGHRVHGVLDDQVVDVHRVLVVGVLHAGRRPQRALPAGAVGLERGPAVAGEELLVGLVGQARVGDAGLALEVGVGAGPSRASRRLSISVSTRETKNDATEWIVDRSWPFSRAFSRPAT